MNKTPAEQVATLTATVDQLQAQFDTMQKVLIVTLFVSSFLVGMIIYDQFT